VKAVIITAVQAERFAAEATLLTVHVARFAVSVREPKIVLLSVGMATATATRAARWTKAVSEGMVLELNQKLENKSFRFLGLL
jgi:hypothetical protein